MYDIHERFVSCLLFDLYKKLMLHKYAALILFAFHKVRYKFTNL